MRETMMKYRTILGIIAALLLASPLLTAADSQKLIAKREHFVKQFDRIGLNTAPEDAQFLRILVESTRAKRGIEVGTATGYGAMLMGMAFEKNGGKLITIDIDPDMVKAAKGNLNKMQLLETVTVLEGDALDVLPRLKDKYDFLFIDAAKRDYLKYFKAIESRMVVGSVIVADNTIRYASSMRDFLDYITNSPNYHSVTIRASDLKNDGMTVIYKLK